MKNLGLGVSRRLTIQHITEKPLNVERELTFVRVLFLIRILDSGGVTTHMMTLGQGLLARGVQVAVASGGRVGIHTHGPEWFSSHGIQHYQVPFPDQRISLRNVRNAIASLRAIRRVVADFRPDIVHVHFRSTSPYAQYIHYSYGIPFVSTLHLEGIPSGPLYRLGSFWGSTAIAISSETKEYLIKSFGVSSDRVRVIHNGVDETYFRPPTASERRNARAMLGVGLNSPVISLIGRLEPVKGHDVLIRALRGLRTMGVKAIAVMAGEGSRRQELEKLATDAGVGDQVRFPGYIDSRTVLWASDALALPSRKEGFALVVVEAMMCGVIPIRTPAAGAADQIKDGMNGFIIPFEDHKALADVFLRLIRDENLRRNVSAAASESARRNFSQRKMVEETLKVYNEVLLVHRGS
ncbi:MAG TPA: glycosyltransferase family 4 protein [Firmicutes bacterium]|nr:glycosyltransferase family 4 protein [Bacillota bacterium]